jgi:DNA-binding transcriptional regulator/RsmH inhibitor MraZ
MSSSSSKSDLDELFIWFQGIPGSIDKFKKLPMSNKMGPDEFIQNIGISLDIEPSVWNDMPHDKRLLTIYEQLPDDEKLDFKNEFPLLFIYPENIDTANQYQKLLDFGNRIDKTMIGALTKIMDEYDKDEKNLVVDAKTERARFDKMISTIGILLKIENWEDKTYDDKINILVVKLRDNLFARNNAKPSIGTEFDQLKKIVSGGRNKSKKPKRRKSRSKRRKTLSKRRR